MKTTVLGSIWQKTCFSFMVSMTRGMESMEMLGETAKVR
jgi:hypothetical protein